MQPEPTGRVHRTGPESYQLTLTRTFTEPAASVWSSFTNSSRAAPWFGRWDGAPHQGDSVDVQMLYEEGLPWSRLLISECLAPELLRVLVEDEYGSWDLEIRLRETPGGAGLEFIHHLDDPLAAESVGPGWEYYLDRLTAVRNGATVPEFEEYYPSQGPYFVAQARAAADADETGR